MHGTQFHSKSWQAADGQLSNPLEKTTKNTQTVCSCVLIVRCAFTHSVSVKPGAKVSTWCTDGAVYQGLYCDLDLDGGFFADILPM